MLKFNQIEFNFNNEFLYYKMRKWILILNIITIFISIVGLIYGYYFFLFLVIPLGFNFYNRKNNNDER
jgi:Sec-independent protein secretion pathway component TatC